MPDNTVENDNKSIESNSENHSITKKIIYSIAIGFAFVLVICIVNYEHQNKILSFKILSKEEIFTTPEIFERKERARGRRGFILGVIPALVSFFSEHYADSISEYFFNTSGRRGRLLDERRNFVVYEFLEYSARGKFNRQYGAPLPKEIQNIYMEASGQIKHLESLHNRMVLGEITDDEIEREEKIFLRYQELKSTLESRGYPLNIREWH